jgi:energy-coupling factor transporter ATP-binding protein EcfA2
VSVVDVSERLVALPKNESLADPLPRTSSSSTSSACGYGATDAVAGINLRAARGEIFAFLGPNGAGKTTTVEILEGFRERTGGTRSPWTRSRRNESGLRGRGSEMVPRAVDQRDFVSPPAAGGCLQTTVFRFESAGVMVSAGIAPSLSATCWERTLSGEIRETSRSMHRQACAQSRMAAAASVAYPCPQCARVNAQPSSG